MLQVDGASETTKAVFRKRPLQRQGTSIAQRPDWRYEHQPRGSNTAYGEWHHNGSASHLTDLRMARSFAQFGAAGHFDGSHGTSRSSNHRSTPPHRDHLPAFDPARHGGNWCAGQRRLCQDADNQVNQGPTDMVNAGSATNKAISGFPGIPGASRGLPTASQALWCFERVPCLLPSPLDRDRGRRGRSCFELPTTSPMHAAVTSNAVSANSRMEGTIKHVEHQQTWAIHDSQRSNSEPKLPSSSFSKPVGSFRERIGMSWDNAAIAAGGAVRGSDGRFLGY
mmetsp:Transcript_83237/g.165256  ORF Transcript_83237/g.165256 Transcript_83237/m.165256 type:complete len:281 (-) Transcript_83237:94-936(-)|eukprot:CAMPEP_0172813496 /NCGR_PEP_ID=MMETSP1075-20121228/10696_1 /TAXON_ID=2916 /ORGANISM="Ceratium fusus, Strain PA161109" /LENGTH=280 /DNA_ID=CAMNT_0013653203 /DNA_START=46 /DNA_END=888 /DNA_ORIENTATION=+